LEATDTLKKISDKENLTTLYITVAQKPGILFIEMETKLF